MSAASEIVDTHAQAAGLPLAPLLVREPLAGFLDALGIGAGPVSAHRIGDGHSNVTFLLERGDERLVLRRGPRPPLPPSAHDMLREARIVAALHAAGLPVPGVLGICDDADVIGAPFFLMELVEGTVIVDRLPPALDAPSARALLAERLLDVLYALHSVDLRTSGLDAIGRPDGYLARQVRRFTALWQHNRTRDLPVVDELAHWLERRIPQSGPPAVVHGDFRLGNVMVAENAPARVAAVLDWELATLGDPLADLGYLVTTWSDAGSPGHVLELSPATRAAGFPSRRELAERYAERTGRRVERLAWYETLALWKGAVFCEEIHARSLRGEIGGEWAARLRDGIPLLLEAAREAAARDRG